MAAHSIPKRNWSPRFRVLLPVMLAAGLLWQPQPVAAQNPRDSRKVAQPAQPRDYTSQNFLLHTDLDPQEAAELLKRLETMIGLISKYFTRPNRQTIECYVVKDLRNWPEGSLHADGRAKIAEGAGVTLTQTLTRGNEFLAKSVVYAVADRGTPQHEAVHAYCAQTFGRTGPVWYSEGLAELGNYWREDDTSVEVHPGILEYIQESTPKTMLEIVNAPSVTGDSWQNYAWRWALCHLLANNPNYSQRFRPLGLALLTNQGVTFEQVYGPMAKEISFEYQFFLEHIEMGYRVDLCCWDWKTKFRAPQGASGTPVKVNAMAGWQPSRVLVKPGVTYEYTSTGTWQLEKDGEALDADGNAAGAGRLLGVVFVDDTYTLSEPFELGKEGTFTPPVEGNLYLRCGDEWGKLADNKGTVTARIKVKK